MAQLSFFTDEDVESIISLPFRAGMFVSYAEDEDGEQDDVREMQALEGCLKEFARVHQGEELTKEIAAATLNAKDKWEAWSQGVFNIEPLCEKAIVSFENPSRQRRSQRLYQNDSRGRDLCGAGLWRVW